MHRTVRIFAAAVIILAGLFLFGPGCSHDSSLDPIGNSTAISQSKASVPTPVVEATTFVETFTNHTNEGDWSFGTDHNPYIEHEGGNPDWYLHDDLVVSFAPHPMTGLGVQSIFTGNYRERNVTSVGIDLRSFWYDLNLSSRYLTLILMNDAGTPLDVSDDWGAYIIGDKLVPSKYVPGYATQTDNVWGWESYDFVIESQSVGLPSGWAVYRNYASGTGKSGGSWEQLMQNVSYVMFYYGDPELYYLLDTYDLGLDNARITWGE